jgi:hypothetical protein
MGIKAVGEVVGIVVGTAVGDVEGHSVGAPVGGTSFTSSSAQSATRSLYRKKWCLNATDIGAEKVSAPMQPIPPFCSIAAHPFVTQRPQRYRAFTYGEMF